MHQSATALPTNASPSSGQLLPPRPYRSATVNTLAILVAALSAYLLYRNPLEQRLRDILNPYSFNGDALQHIAPLWFVTDPTQASKDYIATYYLQAILPPLFKAFYAVLTLLCSPIVASKIVTVSLSAVFILVIAATSLRLSGPAASYISFVLATGGVVKNVYFMGGIQRGFGICIASLALYFMVTGNILAVGALCIISASLYPAATVLILIGLAILLVIPAHLRGSAAAWSLQKRICLGFTCALLSCLAALPQIIAGTHYGERLSLLNEAEFPEWSAQGRYTQGDRGVPVAFFPRVLRVITSGMVASKIHESSKEQTAGPEDSGDLSETDPIYQGVVTVVITAFLAVCALFSNGWRVSHRATRAIVFGVSASIAYSLATVVFPALYIPSRYIALGFIPLTPVLFPCIWYSSLRQLMPSLRSSVFSITVLCLSLSWLVWLGWNNLSLRHLPSAEGYRPLFRFVRSLPPTSVIATWPRGVGNMLPLYTTRTTLLFEEGHQVFHRNVTEETRKRMRALIALYAATDRAPLEELKRIYGVTHLVIDTRHLKKKPSYFEPFSSELVAARSASGDAPLYLEQLSKRDSVYSFGPFVVIDVTGER